MIKKYILKHWNDGRYVPLLSHEGKYYRHVLGWTDRLIGPHLLYSHRTTAYTHELFDEAYHAHTYYELVFYVRGQVDFICGRNILTPPPYSLIWFSPGEFHNARLLEKSTYERYVFRFDKEAFLFDGADCSPLSFMERVSGNFFAVPRGQQHAMVAMLSELEAELERADGNPLVGYSLFIHFLAELNRFSQGEEVKVQVQVLPSVILDIKQYIEDNYVTIRSVSEISEHFFYSREHISRLFKQYFNMSVFEYLTRFRVTKSLSLIQSGKSVTEACFAVGFGSMSAFSASFKKIVGCLPSKISK